MHAQQIPATFFWDVNTLQSPAMTTTHAQMTPATLPLVVCTLELNAMLVSKHLLIATLVFSNEIASLVHVGMMAPGNLHAITPLGFMTNATVQILV